MALSRFMEAHAEVLALIFIIVCGGLLLGSLGLQIRTPLLLVTPSWRPAVVLLSTLAGYVGEATGPPVVGLLKDGLAPLCKTIEVDGEQVVDPRCAASQADQEGLGVVLLMPSILAAIAAALLFIAARAMGHGAAIATAQREARSTEMGAEADFESSR